MILLSHPTGNNFVRALVSQLYLSGLLESFHTTIAFQDDDWLVRLASPSARNQLLRRSYSLPRHKIVSMPFRELVRLAAPRLGLSILNRHESGWASMDTICHMLDKKVASYLLERAASAGGKQEPTGVYAYEDAAMLTFAAARRSGISCFYDLPIAYWKVVRQLLEQEAERLPEWQSTLGGTADSAEKLERKEQELEQSDLVVCPSNFVLNSLPVESRKKAIVAEFGSPEASQEQKLWPGKQAPLRVLFAGALTQRKGLADVFKAMRLLNRIDVELVVMGSLAAPMDFYRNQYPDFIYEQPRPHKQVLELMQTCHVLVLPSIVEGRALVQQEAMACGLPLIATANAGGEDLLEDGKTGFLVPIRSPELIADKLNWLAENRSHLPEMSRLARAKASKFTWSRYAAKIINYIGNTPTNTATSYGE